MEIIGILVHGHGDITNEHYGTSFFPLDIEG